MGHTNPTVSALNGITYDPAIIVRDHSQNVFQQSRTGRCLPNTISWALRYAKRCQHKLALDCRLSVVVGNDGCLECLVIVGIFQCANDCLG
jgi:hypothetical protein